MLITIALVVSFWWLIHFTLYFAAKAIIRRATPQELLAIASSSLISLYHQRKRKSIEGWAMIFGLIAVVALPFFVNKGLFALQKILVFRTHSIYFSEGWFVMPSIILSCAMVYFVWLLIAKKGTTADKDWVRQPSMKLVNQRIQRIKKRLIYLSLVTQWLFVLNMFNFIQMDENGIQYSPFYSLDIQKYAFSDIKEAKMHVAETTHTSKGKRYKKQTPHFEVYFSARKCVELWQSIHWSEREYENLRKAIIFLQENHVPINIDMPGILEKSKYQNYFRRDIYDEIMGMFQFAESIKENRYKAYKIGEPLVLQDITMTIDSSVTEMGEGFYKAPKGKRIEMVHLTIDNHKRDTFIMVDMNMHLYDAQNNQYMSSIFARDSFDSYIPPQTAHSGTVGFLVPDTITQLRLKYRIGFINKRYLWFDLSKNVQNQKNIQ